LKTPISYYGGKQTMVNVLLSMIPEHAIYTELFFGGGSLFFVKKPSKLEVINDTSDLCINFYRQLKMNYPELKKLIEATLISQSLHVKARRICSGKIGSTDIEKAWAFWFSCTFGHTNKLGGGLKKSNDQFTSVPWILHNKKKQFTEHLSKRLENAFIDNRDAIVVLKGRNKENAFHYIDPPYLNADQGHYKGYTEEDFEKLLIFLQNDCTGKFLLSNYPSDILKDYASQNKWNISEFRHPSKHRSFLKTKNEVLVWNYKLPEQMQLEIYL